MKKRIQAIYSNLNIHTGIIDVNSSLERTYSLTSLTLQFFIFSFVGWLWEVLLHIYMDHAFINRGILTGPWLPIYGSGGVLILCLLRRFAANPKKLFLAIMGLAGLMEYGTALFLEQVFHAKWWDYSDMIFHIQGRVCLSGLLIFGIGGCAITYLFAPVLDKKIRTLPLFVRRGIAITLLVIFIGDMIYSGFRPNSGMGITLPAL